MNANDRAWRDKLTGWGHETVLYAMGERSRALGREIDPRTDAARATAAMNEAHNIASLDLWSKAITESGGSYQPGTGAIYCRLVFEWVAKHLGYQKIPSRPVADTDEAT